MADLVPAGSESSDDAISALSERRQLETSDPVLQALSAWVADLDAHPVPPLPVQAGCVVRQRRTGNGRRLVRWAAGLTAALMVSSSGFAAATTGNPWTPLRYVTQEFYELAQRDPGRIQDWTVRGSHADPDRGAPDRESRSGSRPALHRPRHRHPANWPGAGLGVK